MGMFAGSAALSVQDNVIPYFPLKVAAKDTQQVRELDLMWHLFNAFPGKRPRLERTKSAALRIVARRRPHILPPRQAFQTTVDYYEAILPLYTAREHFAASFQVDNCYRGVWHALSTIVPKLFQK